MSSRPNEYPRASAALAGLGLTTQIAAAATDSIPIAKLVLGVALRIINLAEDIEKRRDALYQLAETARVMAYNIQAVVSDRKFSGEIVQSLDGLLSVLRSIEALLEKHKAKSGFRRALGYTFTTSKHVDTLSQELSRAALQFQLVAALDSNARLIEANASLQKANDGVEEINVRVQSDAQYIGEFRRIRQGDVENPELIEERKIYSTSYSSRIYSAKINGSVCILRCFVRTTQVIDRKDGSYWDERLRRDVIRHDRLLDKLSTFQTSHRNIARLYGRSSGESLDRFNVMNLGCIPISEAPQCTATVDGTWNIVQQILDALCHLEARGATWNPDRPNSIFVDGTGAPIIGLHNDLRSSADRWTWWQVYVLGELLKHGFEASWLESDLNADEHHPLAISTVGSIRASSLRTTRHSIPCRLIRSLDEKICSYLRNTLANCEDSFLAWNLTGSALRNAASGRGLGSGVHTLYCADARRQDEVEMYRVEERGDELIYLRTIIEVPFHMKDVYRKTLGITLPDTASDSVLFVSNCDPAEPSSMSFRRICS